MFGSFAICDDVIPLGLQVYKMSRCGICGVVNEQVDGNLHVVMLGGRQREEWANQSLGALVVLYADPKIETGALCRGCQQVSDAAVSYHVRASNVSRCFSRLWCSCIWVNVLSTGGIGGADVMCARLLDDPERVHLFGSVWRIETAVFYKPFNKHYVVYRRSKQGHFKLCDDTAMESVTSVGFPMGLVVGAVGGHGVVSVCVLLYLSMVYV